MAHRGQKKHILPKQKPTMENQNPNQQSKGTVTLNLEHIIPEDVPLQYSDNMIIQHRETMFYLYFMQNEQPLLLSEGDARRIKSVRSVCKNRVVMTPFHFARNLKAMNENFSKFLRAIGSDAKDEKEFLEEMEKHSKTDGK